MDSLFVSLWELLKSMATTKAVSHSVFFMASGVALFLGAGAGAKWNAWWGWTLGTLGLGAILLRMFFYPW